MEKTRFTPGPNYAIEQSTGDSFFICRRDRVIIGITCTGSCGGIEVAEANANLFAAAPEMYEALAQIYNKEGWCWLEPIINKANGKP